MRASLFSFVAALAALGNAQTHGEGEEGKTMGPVAFMWPPDRIWDAQHDNTAPCGSAAGPSNRTIYPLSQGAVALSIADDAWHVAFRLAVSDNPTTQADFDDQVVRNITDVDPGHQCYSIDRLEGITPGTNATIQLEYWAEFEGENNGNNQSFFACADITFVETIDFSIKVPCFNVTSDDFNAPTPSSSGSTPSNTGLSASQSDSADQSSGGGGLSTGAKAGIAVGAVIGGLIILGAIGFFLWRRGKSTGLKNRDSRDAGSLNLDCVCFRLKAEVLLCLVRPDRNDFLVVKAVVTPMMVLACVKKLPVCRAEIILRSTFNISGCLISLAISLDLVNIQFAAWTHRKAELAARGAVCWRAAENKANKYGWQVKLYSRITVARADVALASVARGQGYNRGRNSKMPSPKDMVIDIVELETNQANASGIAAPTSRRSFSADQPDSVRFEPFRRHGAYTGLSSGDGDDDEYQEEEMCKLQTVVYRLTKSTVIRRLLLYYLPPALLLLIPIVITATVAKNVHIGDDVRIVGLFVWLEVIWAIFWGSWGLAFVLPFVLQFFAGFFSPVAKDYTNILKVVTWPMTAFYFALFSRASTPLLCVFDENRPGVCDDAWVLFIRTFFLATIACTGLFFVQKVLIHLLTVNYRKRQFRGRSRESKRYTRILALMYEASVRLHPEFCGRFASEDDMIHRSQTLRATAEGGLEQSFLRKTVNKFYGPDALAETKARLHGKEVLKAGSSRSVVLKALENEQASKALARRLWFSFSMESDAITEKDIARILGSGREEDALDVFLDLDKDENGDISLEEMILLLTQLSRDKKDMARSVHDIGQAIRSLDRILEVFLLFVSIFLYIAFFNAKVAATLTTLWASVAAISFAIAATVQEFLGSLVFLFIKHPYDVGDRVDIGGSELIVEHMALFFTIFRQLDTGGIVQIPNIVNNAQWIKNVSRSKAMKERYSFAVSPKTKWFQLENLKSELQNFVLEPQNKRDYQPNIDVELVSIGDLEKLHLRVEICQKVIDPLDLGTGEAANSHKSNFSNEALRASRRSKFMCALLTALKKHSIKKPFGGKPPDAGSWENPSFSVSVTEEEAARARADWEAREDADREKKMKKLWWDGLGKEI
ncbi:hypothetical protein OPT61_g8447 [Boeremia exigua]|uniref:Uncharacterized protein n=1 Tax=Boeremia exigua TaxID=749465 RepID=A0ACC2HYA5_9PLEO|nr:hypothetical protein OPT61_g8447 [Boeremia exigua]